MSNWIHFDASSFMVIVFKIINLVLSLSIISVLFALMFKILPDAKIKWMHVWLGSILTSVLFTLGKTILAFYFGKANPASGYGAASSVVLILLWVSYSSMILSLTSMYSGCAINELYYRQNIIQKNEIK